MNLIGDSIFAYVEKRKFERKEEELKSLLINKQIELDILFQYFLDQIDFITDEYKDEHIKSPRDLIEYYRENISIRDRWDY